MSKDRMFDRTVMLRTLDEEVELECGHKYKIHNDVVIKDGIMFCHKCVIEFLKTKNEEINKNFQKPIIYKLKPKE